MVKSKKQNNNRKVFFGLYALTEKKIPSVLLVILIGIIAGGGVAINPIAMLGILLLPCLMALTYVKPYQVFVGILIYLPLERIFLAWLPANVDTILSAGPEALCIFIIVCMLIKNNFKVPKLNIIDYCLFLIVTWAILTSIIHESSVFDVIAGFRLFFRGLLIYWIIRLTSLKSDVIFKDFSKVLVIMSICQSILGILQIVGKKVTPSYWNSFGANGIMQNSLFGVQGTFGRYDQYGMFLSFAAIVLLSKYIYHQKEKLTLFAVGLSVIGIFISTSRQALVLFIIGALILFLPSLKRIANLKITFVITYVVLFVSLLAYWFMPSLNLDVNGRNPFELFSSLFNPETYNAQQNVNFRMYYLLNVGPWLMDNHFWGMGLGTFGALFSLYEYTPLYYSLGLKDNFLNYIADVNWVSVIGQLGVPGVLLILTSWVSLAISSFIKGNLSPKYKAICLATTAITVCFTLSGLFGPNFEIKTNAMFFWLLLGLFSKIEKNSLKQN